jgi:hypothetical protein
MSLNKTSFHGTIRWLHESQFLREPSYYCIITSLHESWFCNPFKHFLMFHMFQSVCICQSSYIILVIHPRTVVRLCPFVGYYTTVATVFKLERRWGFFKRYRMRNDQSRTINSHTNPWTTTAPSLGYTRVSNQNKQSIFKRYRMHIILFTINPCTTTV